MHVDAGLFKFGNWAYLHSSSIIGLDHVYDMESFGFQFFVPVVCWCPSMMLHHLPTRGWRQHTVTSAWWCWALCLELRAKNPRSDLWCLCLAITVYTSCRCWRHWVGRTLWDGNQDLTCNDWTRNGGACASLLSWRYCFRKIFLVAHVLSRTVDEVLAGVS